MKRKMNIAFSIMMLCCLLLGTAVTVKATEPGYDITEAYQAGPVDLDGLNDGDWDPGLCWFENITSDARYAYKMDQESGDNLMSWIIESLDNTNDAGDIWQICIDGTSAGGTAPTTDCNKIEVVGHTTLTVYVGTGTDWEQTDDTAVTWAETQQTTNIWGDAADEHYVIEIKANKAVLGSWGGSPPPHGLRVAMYDETTDTWTAWPPTDADVPDEYGIISTYTGTIPEGFSFAAVLMVSTVAVVAAFYFARKRPKTGISHPI
jgi:hypothetical protein